MLPSSLSLEQPCLLSCASADAHLALASHQRMSGWQKTNLGEKKRKKKKSEQFSAGSLSRTASAEVRQAAGEGAGARSCWHKEQTTSLSGSWPLEQISYVIKPHPIFMNLTLAGQAKYCLNWETQKEPQGICILLYLESNNSQHKGKLLKRQRHWYPWNNNF